MSQISESQHESSEGSGNPPLIFFHIVKAAGTTFHSMLTWQYRGYPSYWIPNDLEATELRAMPAEMRRRFVLVRGHMNFGLHELLAPGARYITFLREPVSRLTSYYRFGQSEGRRHASSDHWWFRAMREWSIDEFLDSRREAEFDNGQVRRISGLASAPRPCSQEDLERAKDNLRKHFLFAGVTNRFDESVLLLARMLGWQWPLMYRRENVRREREPLPARVVDRLRELNIYDQQLFEYVEDELARRIADEPDIESRLRALRRRNKTISLVPDSMFNVAKSLIKRTIRPARSM